ncbi:MAG: alpha-amylase family glycosyl hydrolase [Bacteroidota bacterium]
MISSCKEEKDWLHVPSPNWEDQIIYFLLTDRFADGDASNNDQGDSEYDPSDDSRWHGGDFDGIRKNLDYIEKLGATTIWLTPPVLNQTWNPDRSYTGYHGYWAAHFEQTDPHYGSLEAYQNLSRALHKRGMFLIQDVVVNHTGDYFQYLNGYDPSDPKKGIRVIGAPSQSPLDMNDPNNPEHLAAGIYHFTPSIQDFGNKLQKLTYQLSDLDDLATEKAEVRELLMQAYRFWIEQAGVDGYRFDTAVYVDHPFWNSFLHQEGESMGIETFAATLGKDEFYTFGETWIASPEMTPDADRTSAAYLGTVDKPEMDAVLNFPLQQSLMRVFGEGKATENLAYRMESQTNYFKEPANLLNFIDNHDMVRFRSVASEEAYQQAMSFLLTYPGVPVIYQGTEQGQIETRGNLFDDKKSGSQAFKFIQKLIEFRKDHPALRSGAVTIHADSKHCGGLLVYALKSDDETLYFAVNNQDHRIVTSDIDLGLRQDAHYAVSEAYSLGGEWKASGVDGKLHYLELGPKEFLVFQLIAQTANVLEEESRPTMEALSSAVVKTDSLNLAGQFNGDEAQLVINGNLDAPIKLNLNKGKWAIDLSVQNLMNGRHYVQVLGRSGNRKTLSEKQYFDLNMPYRLLVDQKDPLGDDRGPEGTYVYPTDASFAPGQMDLKNVSVLASGNNLLLDIELWAPLSTIWAPFNGFDHVNFNIYFSWKGKNGKKYLPHQNTNLPEGKKWQLGATVFGWGATTFSEKGATATAFGELQTLKPNVKAIPERNAVQLEFPAQLLPYPDALDDLEIYLTTFDAAGEGGLRPLKPEAEAFSFGGGKEEDPKWVDELLLRMKNEE